MTTTVDLEQNPAVVRRDWVPDSTPWSVLNQLHDEHVQTLNDLSQISAEYHTLRAKYEMEDDQALEAQQRAYSNGDDATKLPKRTPQGTRTTRLNELMERGKVVQAHLRELVNRIVSTVIQHELDWTDELRQGEYRANEQVKELKAQLAEAQEVAEHTPDLRTWLERTAKNRTGDHLHFGWFSSKPTTDLLTISNEGRSKFNSIPSNALLAEEQGGGIDKEHPSKTTEYDDETLDYSSDEYIDQLDEQLRDHARKRRVGSATPGGM